MSIDSDGKISCAICGKWRGHVIVKHLREKHPKVTIFEYLTDHDAPVASPKGFATLRAQQAEVPRSRSRKTIHEVFNLEPCKDEKATPERKFVNREVEVFDDPSPYTPEVDPDYVFPEHALRLMLVALTLKSRNNIWFKGYAGTGKTQLVMQVAARMNIGVRRVQGDVALTRRHLVGDWTVRGSETVFEYGIVPQAMRSGDLLLLDEVDNLNPAALVILRSVLEHPSTLTILENGGELIRGAEHFRIAATANTSGAGDESGLFTTSRALSLADRQRFSLWAEVPYLSPKVEVDMVRKRFPKLTDFEARRFYQVVKAIRDRHKAGEFEESFSPRELVNWVEKYFLVGDAAVSANACFIERYASQSVAVAVSELVRAAFDRTAAIPELPAVP